MEHHHRGQGVILKVISPPFVRVGAVSIVEDEFGNADKLAIYNHPNSSILSGVPEGCVVAVKEPYYQHSGGNDNMICVDHPSDVLLLRFTDPIIPESLRLGLLLKTSEDWRKAGDTAFLGKDLPTAVFCYTEALEEAKGDDVATIKAPIHAKRSGVNLMLGRHDAAKADALVSCTGGAADWKAYFNAGRAAYELRDYAASKAYLGKAVELKPKAAAVQREYQRCLARLREEETGDYDFRALYLSLNAQNVHLDVGSFLRNTAVAKSKHHGNGMFATRDIKAGEVVFVEKAMFMPNQYEPALASAALYSMIVQQLFDSPSLAKTVLTMYAGDYERSGAEGTTIDGVSVVDVFLVECIRQKNCFSMPPSTLDVTKPTSGPERQAKALWTHASAMNHSCTANVIPSFLGDILICRATSNISKGDEVFQPYVPVKVLPDLRNRQLKETWGFECGCALCSGERKSPAAILAKRRELVAQIEKACNKKLPGKGSVLDATTDKVEKLHKQLEDLHEPEVYNHLPRLTLIYPCNWLAGAHRARKNWNKVVKYGTGALRNFGFQLPVEEGAVWDPRTIYSETGENQTMMSIHVVSALRKLAEGYEALGNKEMAARCIESAEFGYMLVTGFENDLNGMDPDIKWLRGINSGQG